MKKTDFRDLSFNISNYCISSCKYCALGSPNKWNLSGEMDIKHIESFLTDSILKNLITIHLTGGEPFLSSKLLSIVDIIKEYHTDVSVNAPTNALYPELIYRLMKVIIKKLPQYRLNIGIEGPTKEIHESIRGKGSWEPMLETVHKLRHLGVSMLGNTTIYKENYKYIRDTKALCDKLGLGFYLNFGRYSIRFGNEKDAIRWYGKNENGIDSEHRAIVQEMEEAISDIGWLKERQANGEKWVAQKARWEGKTVRWNCLAGIEGIDVFSNGDVYPCLMYDKDYYFGNLKTDALPSTIRKEDMNNPLSQIMHTKRAREIQERIYNGDCSERCPFTCQLRRENITIDGIKIKASDG